jgi:Holliday junction DNA helicase RuvA
MKKALVEFFPWQYTHVGQRFKAIVLKNWRDEMISVLHGTVISQEADGIIIDVNGIGFLVMVPKLLRDQVKLGEAIYLYTRMIIRADAWILCGFETREERDVFDLLLGVNGIGPRLALSVLSTLTPAVIYNAVINNQADIFTRVPGVGKKTAQRIVLHMQDRLPAAGVLTPLSMISDVDSEVLAALTNLGYSLVEAQTALQIIPRDTPQDIETRLRIALQYFSSP